MPAVRKPSTRRTPVVAKPLAKVVAAVKDKAFAGSAVNRTTKKPAVAAVDKTVAPGTLVSSTPELKKGGTDKRKRLSRAFSRPLDKKLKQEKCVRERFTLLKAEYDQLALLKKRLSDQGLSVKKSELVRAGLMLLAELEDGDLKELLAKVPAVI
jgi:hypothetical protein